MFLKRWTLNRIGPRLVIWSTLLLAFSLICVSTTIYYLLSSSLRKNDRELILKMADTYSHAAENFDISTFNDSIPPEIFLSIIDKNGQEIFTSAAKYIDRDFEDEEEIEQTLKAMQKLPLKNRWDVVLLFSGEEDNSFFHRLEHKLRIFVWQQNWLNLLPLIDNDMVEIYSLPIQDGQWLRIGRSFEDREEYLSDVRYFSFYVILPFIGFGFLLSLFLALTILSPLKRLTRQIQRIRKGEQGLRAKVSGSNDEVDQLALHFNDLIEHNEKLIDNLKSTLDNVAHDLRTPLTRFRIQAEKILSKDHTVKEYQEALLDGVENIDRITTLLNAIMDVSEAKSATLKIHKKTVHLLPMIERLLDLFQYTAEEKDIRLESEIPPEISISVDEVRFLQALSNLLDNAIKYSPASSKVIVNAEVITSTNKTKSSSTPLSFVKIYIADEGPGISEKDLPNIWNRLYRADHSRSTQGLGLGLSLVKAVITAHNGEVEVASTLDQGTIFCITLPLCNDYV